MPLIATNKGGGDFTPVPAGNHLGICYQILHIGTIESQYQGETRKRNVVRLVWELPNETKTFKEEEGPKPFSIGKDYTLSMNEKSNLRKHIEGWIGTALHDSEAESFDVEALLGKPCMINVIHAVSNNGKTYAEVSAVAAVPKGLPVPSQTNESRSLNYENFDLKIFEKLPVWIKDKIKASDEYKAKFLSSGGQDENSEIPF